MSDEGAHAVADRLAGTLWRSGSFNTKSKAVSRAFDTIEGHTNIKMPDCRAYSMLKAKEYDKRLGLE